MLSSKEILLRLKGELELSIFDANVYIHEVTESGNYQDAANIKMQILGKQFAISLIREKLETLKINE